MLESCTLHITEDDLPYGDLDFSLTFEVVEVDERGRLLAKMLEDTHEYEEPYWSFPEGEIISITGSTYDGEELAEGFLHVGRSINFIRDGVDYWGYPLQEVVVCDPVGVDMALWDTNPMVSARRKTYEGSHLALLTRECQSGYHRGT